MTQKLLDALHLFAYSSAESIVVADRITSSAVRRDLKPCTLVTFNHAIEIVSLYYDHIRKEEV